MNADNVIDYYGILGVQSTATISEIHKAYWQMVSICHPDKGGSHEKMVQLVEAWQILSNPDKRARYDQLLKYRHNGWHSRRFDDDVQEARKRAKDDSARSWDEFEAIYQKAFSTFNQDFYGDEMNEAAAGPYSPLMLAKNAASRGEDTMKVHPPGKASHTWKGPPLARGVTILILLVAVVAALLLYRTYSGIGRFVPLGQEDAASVRILDTTTGAVYSLEKRNGAVLSPWKEVVPPVPREKK
jgi:hypothetical protein